MDTQDGRRLQDAAKAIAAPVVTAVGALPSAADIATAIDAAQRSAPMQITGEVSGTVAVAGSSGSAVTSVGDSATSVTLLANNAVRKGASFFNESSAILYLKCGATASATSYTTQIQASGYYELPFGYSGIVDGIWASDAGGSVRITEFT